MIARRTIAMVLAASLLCFLTTVADNPAMPGQHPLGMVRDPRDPSQADYFSISDEEIAKHPKWKSLAPSTEIVIHCSGYDAKDWKWAPPTQRPPEPVEKLARIALDSKCPPGSAERKDWHVIRIRLQESYGEVLLQYVPRPSEPGLHAPSPVYLFLDGTIIQGKRGGAPAAIFPGER
ncbi:MAG: hypothetical protein ACYC35_27140 [Pirellulales bacterium]